MMKRRKENRDDYVWLRFVLDEYADLCGVFYIHTQSWLPLKFSRFSIPHECEK